MEKFRPYLVGSFEECLCWRVIHQKNESIAMNVHGPCEEASMANLLIFGDFEDFDNELLLARILRDFPQGSPIIFLNSNFCHSSLFKREEFERLNSHSFALNPSADLENQVVRVLNTIQGNV